MFYLYLKLAVLNYGSTSAFFQGDIRKIAEDFQIFKPTLLGIVPRLLNKLYALVNTILFKLTSLIYLNCNLN